MDLVNYISKLQTNVFALRNDDDLADRLNYRYTVAILVAFAIIVSHRQFSETGACIFTPNYEAYANQVCWISNTYYVNQTQNIPKTDESRKTSEIKYYQWIPFILLIQALFLYIPRILWRLLSARAGLDMRDIIEAAHSYKSVEKYANKQKILEYIVQNIDQYASNPRRSKMRDSIFQRLKYFGESLFCGSGIYLGNYLVTTYFFIKIVYLVNSIVQFFVMNEFLGKQFHELGLDIFRYLSNTYTSDNSADSVYFPKVVMCDFRIREFGHPNFSHRYTIQCVLPINLYNQQIFTFLWFWFIILFGANLWALFQWINRMLPKSRRRYVNKRLNLLKYFKELNETTAVVMKPRGIFGRRKSVSIEAKRQKRKFIDEYLKFDGVFILRMVGMLTSEIVCTDLLHELWNKRAVYKEPDMQIDNDNYNNDNNCDYYDNSDRIMEKNENLDNDTGWNPQNIQNNYGYNLNYDENLNQPNQFVVDYDNQNQKFEPVPEDQIITYSKPKKNQLAKLKQQFSFDILNSNRSSKQKIKRMQSQQIDSQFMSPPYSVDENQNAIEQPIQIDRMPLSVRNGSKTSSQLTGYHSSMSRMDSVKAKPKKVVFASSIGQENLNDIDDVFKDLKIET